MTESPAEQNSSRVIPTQSRSGRSTKWWKWIGLLFLVLAIGAGVMFFMGGRADPPAQAAPARGQGTGPPRSVSVAVATARSGEFNVYLSGLGSVTPLNTVTVKPRVDGQIMRVLFQEGQPVRQGDVLAEIDPRPFQVQLSQAEGQMARDQALLRNAQVDLQRYRTLFEQDSIARQQLDTQESLVRQLEGAIKADQAQIDTARLQLTYSRVTAPLSGRLGLRQVDAGNVVHAGDATGLVVITQVQPIAVTFTIAEDNLLVTVRKLRSGEQLVVDAYDRSGKNKLGSGVLLSADNQIDATTGTVKLKAQFPNEDESLFPNQFVNAKLLVEVRHDAVIIPAAAIQRGTQGTFVYVVKPDDTVTVRPVKSGPVEGENCAIESGVQAGERVVVDGTDKLREGAKVELQVTNGQKVARERDAAGPPKEAGTAPAQREGKRRRDGAPAPAN
jgi:multidrug efflux system membrane fusion protein